MYMLNARRGIKAQRLMHDYRLDAKRTLHDLQEALQLGLDNKPGGVHPLEFSIRDLAEECFVTRDGEPCGYRFVKEYMNPNAPVAVQEAISAVDSTAFRNITGQLLIRSVLQDYQNPAFVLSALIPSVPTPFTRGEKIPGIAMPKNPENDRADALLLGEAEEYRALGFSEEYIELPSTEKRGLYIPVTREAVFEDLTGQVIRRAQFVGGVLGLSKEKRLTDLVIGYTNNYKEKRASDTSATSRNTYYRDFGSVTTEPWINHLDDNELLDYTDIDAADDLFTEMTDPNTSEPIVINARQLVYCPQKASTVRRIMTAQEVRDEQGTTRTTISGNPVRPNIQTIESVYVYNQIKTRFSLTGANAKTYWFYGDLTRAFQYQENWPITVLQAPVNSEAEFMQDVVFRFKATEKGKESVIEPRFITRHRGALGMSSSS
jgi:hypothetical protein